jgi:acetyl esterase/lipase
MRRLAIAAAMMAMLGLAVAPVAAGRQAVKVKRGIVYGEGQVKAPAPGSFKLLMDLYRPAPVRPAHRSRRGKPLRPALVLIHGGSFVGGSRSSPDLDAIARGLAARGILVANIDYRVIRQAPVPSKRVAAAATALPDTPLFNGMMAAVDDTLTAFDWLRERARKLRINTRRFGIAGSSAGAITAINVAYQLDDFGIKTPHIRFVGDLWGGLFFDLDTVEKGEAPLFTVHGSADGTVPIVLDERLVDQARAVGIQVEYYRVPDAGHSFGPTGFFTREVRPGQTAFDRMLRFASRRLL